MILWVVHTLLFTFVNNGFFVDQEYLLSPKTATVYLALMCFTTAVFMSTHIYLYLMGFRLIKLFR